MNAVYVVVYNHPSFQNLKKITTENGITKDFLTKYTNGYYDIGDDPSFYCAETFKANITWGICRPDIRRNIMQNDIVVFFCFNSECLKYYFIGFATVERVIKQTDIWNESKFSNYRNYFNLLIRLRENKWEHFEPLFNKKGLHKDWISRLGSKYPSDSFSVKNNFLLTEFEVNQNYVLFHSGGKYLHILKKPIFIAEWRKGLKKEEWNKLNGCNELKEHIFSKIKRDSLRIHERNSAHRHIKIVMDEWRLDKWRDDFDVLINKLEQAQN